MSNMAYVGIKSCGCCEAAAVDDPRFAKDNAKFCMRLIRDGYTVERKPLDWVRTNLRKCTHKPQIDGSQPELF